MFNDNRDDDDGSPITALEWVVGAFCLIMIGAGVLSAIFR